MQACSKVVGRMPCGIHEGRRRHMHNLYTWKHRLTIIPICIEWRPLRRRSIPVIPKSPAPFLLLCTISKLPPNPLLRYDIPQLFPKHSNPPDMHLSDAFNTPLLLLLHPMSHPWPRFLSVIISALLTTVGLSSCFHGRFFNTSQLWKVFIIYFQSETCG